MPTKHSAKKARTIAKRQARQKKIFIKELRKCDEPIIAAERAGIVSSTAYVWKGEDREFSAAWDNARQRARAQLKSSAHEDALKGDRETRRFLLKARFPKEFNTDRLEVEIKNSVAVRAIVMEVVRFIEIYVPTNERRTIINRFYTVAGLLEPTGVAQPALTSPGGAGIPGPDHAENSATG